MFQKILVPLDGSEHSLKALDVAIQIAKNWGKDNTYPRIFSRWRAYYDARTKRGDTRSSSYDRSRGFQSG